MFKRLGCVDNLPSYWVGLVLPQSQIPWHQPTHSSLHKELLSSQISGTTHGDYWSDLAQNPAQVLYL